MPQEKQRNESLSFIMWMFHVLCWSHPCTGNLRRRSKDGLGDNCDRLEPVKWTQSLRKVRNHNRGSIDEHCKDEGSLEECHRERPSRRSSCKRRSASRRWAFLSEGAFSTIERERICKRESKWCPEEIVFWSVPSIIHRQRREIPLASSAPSRCLSFSLDHKYFAIVIRLFHYGCSRRDSSSASLSLRDYRQQRKEIINFELTYLGNRRLVSEIS